MFKPTVKELETKLLVSKQGLSSIDNTLESSELRKSEPVSARVEI